MRKCKNLCKDFKSARPISLDVENAEALDAKVDNGNVDGESEFHFMESDGLRRG